MEAMRRKKLPIGIQTFREIREDDCYYVDKTGFALKLATEGKAYFLSRPRRFGKSLFIDTLAELFAGNEPLFRGLYCHDRWDWSVRYPVIRISFAEGVMESRADLDRRIDEVLRENEQRLGLTGESATVAGRFGALIRGEDVTIADFGAFRLHHIDAREGQNFATGERCEVPEKTRVTFRSYNANSEP